MKAKLLFVFCLFLVSQTAFSQSYMIVRKKGSLRKFEYYVGSEIVYRQNGVEAFFTDHITEFADSTVIMKNNIVLISQIAEVDVRRAESNRPQIYKVSETLLPTLGIGLMAIDMFNHSVVDGKRVSLDKGTTITAGALIATGYGLKLMRRKKIDLTNPKFEAYIIGL